ncbi:hypothetical protein [Streptomyces sp. NBC_00582]|uniref:hypothetical protein n=1 Tax=Streptomyces sp. NBC_00582 TaxID=2975783 RepID=UPI001063FD29|nr:hypothetical protein [Streptomyces sp. NBC_00582]WUB66051.1 hypothetical protein OG852_39355 [Streptomyces sp. NBC_00582]
MRTIRSVTVSPDDEFAIAASAPGLIAPHNTTALGAERTAWRISRNSREALTMNCAHMWHDRSDYLGQAAEQQNQ